MSDIEEDFNTTDGGSDVQPLQCSALHINAYVVMKKRPCKVVEMSMAKTGKHGSAKAHLVAMDLFTGKKYEENVPSTAMVSVPVVTHKEYDLLDINEGYLVLMDTESGGETREDVKIPQDDVGKEISSRWENIGDNTMMVTVMKAMGEEKAVRSRIIS